MHWLSILGIGLAANLDNLGIGVAFGARTTKVPWVSNLTIAVLSVIAAYVSTGMGSLLSRYMPTHAANGIGGLLIVAVGIWSLRGELAPRQPAPPTCDHSLGELQQLLHSPDKADKNGDHVLSWQESLTLGLALALNCVAGGFGAGVTGLSPLATSLSVGVFSLLTIDLGVRAGRQLAQTWLGQWANRLGGMLLILIGCYEIFV